MALKGAILLYIQLLKLYWFAASTTLIIWIVTLLLAGWSALLTVIVLTLLEVTFSADNAVVNSKVLVNLSRFWQIMFLTVGIVLAVFAVRFVLPILIVMIGAGLGFTDVLNLALYNPTEYATHLHQAAPAISAFGGTFLLLIALSFFIDYEKQTHWLHWLEKHLGKLGQYDNFTTFIMLIASVVLYLTVSHENQTIVLLASVCAMALHSGLDLLDAMFAKSKTAKAGLKVGVAAFAAFLYLQVLDASFSLDGVIGAFAITNNVLLIMAGLGAGAVWVRSMTIHMVKVNALNKYMFLEHGAHWAIGFLGAIMLLKLYEIEPPEWFVGSLGLVFIILAILWSKWRGRMQVAQ
jgi:uncharacterized protein